jgi:hypothetical protein
MNFFTKATSSTLTNFPLYYIVNYGCVNNYLLLLLIDFSEEINRDLMNRMSNYNHSVFFLLVMEQSAHLDDRTTTRCDFH